MADLSDLTSLAVEAAPDAIIAIDDHARVVVFNQAAADIFEIEVRTILGQPLTKLAGAEDLVRCLTSAGSRTWLFPGTKTSGPTPFNVNVATVQVGSRRLAVGTLRYAARGRSLDERPAGKAKMDVPTVPEETAYDVVFLLDEDGMVLTANLLAERMFGFKVSELEGQAVTMILPLVHGTALPASVGNFLEFDADGLPRAGEGRHKSGHRLKLEVMTSPMLMDGRKVFVTILRSASGRERVEAVLREAEHRLAAIADNVPGMVFQRVLRPDGGIGFTYVSEGCRDILGVEPEELIADPGIYLNAIGPAEREPLLAALRQSAETLTPVDEEVSVLTRTGQLRWLQGRARPRLLPSGEVAWDGVAFDVTQRKATEDKLLYLAYFDALTGAANRNLFLERFTYARKAADKAGRILGVLSLGFDRFGIINTTMGHAAGDQVLTTAAERLQQCLTPGDTLARAGGDRFLVLLANVADEDDVAGAVERIMSASSTPLQVNGEEIDLTVCVGVARYPTDGGDAETLIKNADTALGLAKGQGPESVQTFTHDLNSSAVRTLSIQNRLRRAIENREFIAHYQPQIDLLTGRIVGMEALIRWQSPEHGLVPPGDFIPVAEEFGLIDALCEQVLQLSCRQNRAWQDMGVASVPIAVNLSGRQFHRSRQLVATLEAVLAETGLDPSFLELEITETSAMHDPDGAIAIVGMLKEMGLATAIDDFGTGYSSLSVLKRFPISKLKIDRSFVSGVTDDPNDAAIVQAIIAMAKALSLTTVAEGVELDSHLAFLRSVGCDQLQGYLFSPALPADQIEVMLRQDRRLPLPPL